MYLYFQICLQDIQKASFWKTSVLEKVSFNLTSAPWNLELTNMAVLREKHILSREFSRQIHPLFSGYFYSCFAHALLCFYNECGQPGEQSAGEKNELEDQAREMFRVERNLLDLGVLSPPRWPVLCMKWYQQAPPSPACTRSCSLFSWSWSAAHWARQCPFPPGATGGG